MPRDIGTLVVRLTSENAQFLRGLKQAEGRLSAFSAKMGKIGSALTMRVTAPLATLSTLATRTAIGFESAFTGVRKTVNATEEEFARLRSEIRQMAKEVPTSAVGIAGIAEAAGQLGIQTQNITGFSRVMVDLGETTNLAGQEAATALARLANITQMNQGDFDRLGSTIVELGNNLATTEAEIVEMGLRLAGAGKTIGLTEHQILALAGALSSVGVNAEAGGTAFSRVMVALDQAAALGGKKLEMIANVAGMTGEQFKQAFEEDAANALVRFVEGLGAYEEAGGNVHLVLEQLGMDQMRLRDALLRSAGAGELMRRSLDLGARAWRENTALTREAELRYKTTGAQLKILWNQVQDLGITLGDLLIPIVRKVVAFLQDFFERIGNLAKRLQNADAATKKLVAGIAALVAGIGPALKIIALLTSPIGLVIAAIGVLALAFFTWKEQIIGFAKGLYQGIKKWMVDHLSGVWNWFKDAIEKIVDVWRWVYKQLRPLFNLLGVELPETLDEHVAGIGGFFGAAADAVKKGGEDMLGTLRRLKAEFDVWWLGLKEGTRETEEITSAMEGYWRKQEQALLDAIFGVKKVNEEVDRVTPIIAGNTKAVAKSTDELANMIEGWGQSWADVAAGVIDDSKNIAQAVRDMVNRMIRDLLRLAAYHYILRHIFPQAPTPAPAGGTSGEALEPQSAAAPGGGILSMHGSAPPVVNVFNAPAETRVVTGRAPSGAAQIDIYIQDRIDALLLGGAFDRTFARAFHLFRQGVTR